MASFKMKVESAFLSKLLSQLAERTIRFIKKRTRAGYDVDGIQFLPYSPEYKKRRAKKGLTTSKVDLKFSDYKSMLSTLGYELGKSYTSVAVFFEDDAKDKLAYYHSISGAGKGRVIRDFFGLNSVEFNEIEDYVKDEWPEYAEKIIDNELINATMGHKNISYSIK